MDSMSNSRLIIEIPNPNKQITKQYPNSKLQYSKTNFISNKKHNNNI